MNRPAELLDRCRAAGLRLRPTGGHLAVSPVGKLTPELAAELRAAKAELLALLATEATPPPPPPILDALDAPHLAGWDRFGHPLYRGTEREWRTYWRRSRGRPSCPPRPNDGRGRP